MGMMEKKVETTIYLQSLHLTIQPEVYSLGCRA